MKNENINDRIDEMNNLVELHIHLDGALSVANCKKLAKIQNINIPEDDNVICTMLTIDDNCRNLNDFLTKFEFPLSLLQTTEGIKNAVKNLADELIDQGIIYAEIRFAPQLSTNKGLTQEQVVEAAVEGAKLSKLHCNLICCCMRGNDNYDKNIETVNVASKFLGKGVVAIDLAGAEGLYPTKNFEDIFMHAKELNIPFTIHAGEADGASSVQDAIRFGAQRIGHGVRAIDDEKVIEQLANKNITLEICPTSNLCTCVYEDIKDIPVMEFISRGVNVTINTDDPTVCNVTLKDELKKIANCFGWTYDDVLKLQLNAINSSFASHEEKEQIIKEAY